ncbi:hypothetical protein ABZ297_29480 [Nonomuraea sp. NPDC005983]|uniref:hypothetical protein n=1 Tax=Nonomuraea sp. NPDC005983 TaxID=3155595 RepID=UPI0033B24516
MIVKQRAEAVHAALEAARSASSVHDEQPLSFDVAGEEIGVCADGDGGQRPADSAGRELLINCGAALFNMRTALLGEGYRPVVRVMPDPDRPCLLATVDVGSEMPADAQARMLVQGYEPRLIHRVGFTGLPVPSVVVQSLARHAAGEGAKLTVIGSPEAVRVLAALTQAAQAVQAQGRGRFALEMLHWARPLGASHVNGHRRNERDGQADHRALGETGVVALLSTPRDTQQEWIATGQALQSVLLRASARGFSAAFHSQALGVHYLREFLRQELCAGEYPQVIMRLGVAADDEQSVCRPLPGVLD